MTAMASEPGAAAFALANKRQKEKMGQRVLETSGRGWSFVTNAKNTAWGKIRGLAKALKVDALLETVIDGARNMVGKVVGAGRWVGNLLGWRNLALFAITSPETRATVYAFGARVGIRVSRALAWTEHHLGRLPLVGRFLKRGMCEARHFVMRYAIKALTKVETVLTNTEAHELGGSVMSGVNAAAGLAMTDRIFRRFVPEGYRRPLMIVAFLAIAVRFAQTAYAAWQTRNDGKVEQALADDKAEAKPTKAHAKAKETEQVKAAADTVGLKVVELTGDETPAQVVEAIAAGAAQAETHRKNAEAAGITPAQKVAAATKAQAKAARR